MTTSDLQQSNLTNRAKRYATVISLLFGRQQLSGRLASAHRGARHLSLGVKLSNPLQLDKALKLSEPLALASATRAVLAQRDIGQVTYQFELHQAHWQYYLRGKDVNGLQLGLAEQRRPIEFQLDPPHALIAGTTGSGKSETVKSALIALLSTYNPGELGLVLIDPNRDYNEFHNAAHLVAPVVSNLDDISDTLNWTNEELNHRIREDIKDGPILLVVIDEAERALADTRDLGIAYNLASQGRKYRIHLMIATQKPTEKSLPGLIDKLNNRFIGLVANAQLSAQLTGQAGLEAHKLTGKGDFIHIAGATNERFQVAIVSKSNYDTLQRSEVKPLQAVNTEIITLPVEKPTGGRPRLEVDPIIAARYFWTNPNKISIAQARELFGLSRVGHDLHKDFVLRFVEEYLRLRQMKRIGA